MNRESASITQGLSARRRAYDIGMRALSNT